MRRRIWTMGTAVLALCLGSGAPGMAQAQDQNEQAQDEQQQRQQERSAEDRDQQEDREREQAEEEQGQRQEEDQARQSEQEQRQREQEGRAQQQRDQQQRQADRESQAFPQEQQRVQLGLRLEDRENRLVVAEVRDQSLAAQAGLQAGDTIVSINGRRIASVDQLRQIVGGLSRLRGRVPVSIVREGELQTLYLDLDRDRQRAGRDAREAWLGVVLDPRYEDAVVVRRVMPDSAADEAGIQEGDWIIGINNRRVQSPAHLASIIDRMRPGERVELRVARRVTRRVEAQLGSMGERFPQDELARRPESPFDEGDEAFDGGYLSGYRDVPDEDVFEETEGEEIEEQGRRLRDRLNREQGQRPLRDRLEGVRDRTGDRRGGDR